MTKNKEPVASDSYIITNKTTKKYYFIRPYLYYNNKVSKELKDRKTTTKSMHQKQITSDHAPESKRNKKKSNKNCHTFTRYEIQKQQNYETINNVSKWKMLLTQRTDTNIDMDKKFKKFKTLSDMK